MILLPIGHEESGTRRLPWVTFSVMAICVVAFLVTGRASLFSEDDLELSTRMNQVLEYYAAHPEWKVIEVTRRAVEETASEILGYYTKRFGLPTMRGAPSTS